MNDPALVLASFDCGRRRRNVLARLQASVLLLVILIGLAARLGLYNYAGAGIWMSSLATVVTAWHFYSWRLAKHTVFEPYALFLLAATLFNAGQGILEALHLNDNGILGNEFEPKLIIQALYLVTLGLASLHFGAFFALTNHGAEKSGRIRTGTVQYHKRAKATRLAGYTCIAFSIVPLAFVLRDALTVSLAHGYGGLYGRQQSELLPGTVIAMAGFAIPGAMFVVAGSAGKKASVAFAAALISIYSISMLMVGFRSAAIMPLVAFSWIYDRSVRRLPGRVILAVGVILLAVIPIVAEIRTSASYWRNRAKTFDQVLLEKNLIVTAVSEMGGSLRTVAYTIDLFPRTRRFDMGISYAYAASTLIPNVQWKVHPAVSHGLLSDWLISNVDPDIARIGGVLGYSFLAEEFANFGWYGVALISAVLGYILIRLFRWGTADGDPAKAAMIAAFLASFLVFARGESASIVRSLAWYACIPYLVACIITSYLPRRQRPVMSSVSPKRRDGREG